MPWAPQLAENHASDREAAPAPPEEPAGAAGEGPCFVLVAVEIEGVTVYGPEDLRPLYQDLLGQEVTLDSVFALAEAVTAHYRNDRYTLSQAIVPPQTIRAGEVRLTVVEGFIDKVLIEGAPRGRAGLFRAWGEEPVQDAGVNGHSVFARQLMNVLGSMQTDGLGSELYPRVKSGVAKLAPQVPPYGGVISAGHELGGGYLLELGS